MFIQLLLLIAHRVQISKEKEQRDPSSHTLDMLLVMYGHVRKPAI